MQPGSAPRAFFYPAVGAFVAARRPTAGRPKELPSGNPGYQPRSSPLPRRAFALANGTREPVERARMLLAYRGVSAEAEVALLGLSLGSLGILPEFLL